MTINLPDMINAVFEFSAAFFTCLNIRQLWRDKEIKGFSPAAVIFFSAWGFYNCFFYPHLGQWWSFAGGIAITCVNCIYMGLIWYYLRRQKKSQHAQNLLQTSEIVIGLKKTIR